jgi:hypothetical protein
MKNKEVTAPKIFHNTPGIFSRAKNVINITDVKDYQSQTIIGVVAALPLQTIVLILNILVYFSPG